MPQLNIPYRSQWDQNDANLYAADCGPTCVAMILNYYGIRMAPNDVYAILPPNGQRDEKKGVTWVYELEAAFKKHNVVAYWRKQSERTAAFSQLRATIDAAQPMIALVKYQPWREATGNQYDGGHFVVITGYTDTDVLIHDPLFGLWAPISRGTHLAMSYDLFAAGWGSFSGGNPNWGCLVVGNETTPPPSTSPPAPEPVTPPTPSDNIMEDEERRIRALAAYRWAAPPDFGDETAVLLWRTHLGDFGLTYDSYTVRPGDTLVGIAGRFYGEQHRWPAIQAYNNLQRESLWAGETLHIPHLGQTGAHTNPALPSDTSRSTRAIGFDNRVNPELGAQDYNDLSQYFIGIGADSQR